MLRPARGEADQAFEQNLRETEFLPHGTDESKQAAAEQERRSGEGDRSRGRVAADPEGLAARRA